MLCAKKWHWQKNKSLLYSRRYIIYIVTKEWLMLYYNALSIMWWNTFNAIFPYVHQLIQKDRKFSKTSVLVITFFKILKKSKRLQKICLVNEKASLIGSTKIIIKDLLRQSVNTFLENVFLYNDRLMLSSATYQTS